MVNRNRKLLVICGPTGTGKTDLGIRLAKKFNGAIISADSRQVYKGLDWGTNKFGKTEEEREKWEWDEKKKIWVREGIETYLYDVVEPGESFSVFDFIERAGEIARELWREGKLPIVVGGTGFYVRGLTCGIETGGIPADWDLRRKWEDLTVEELQEILKKEGKRWFNLLNDSDRKNSRRLIRKIEIVRSGREKPIEPIGADVLKIGLKGERKRLFEKGEGWVEAIVEGGLIEEVRLAREKGWGESEPLQGMIYRPVQEFLRGKVGRAEMAEKIKREVRDYIKRQLVYLAREPGVEWFDILNANFAEKVENRVWRWYSVR